jgi:hypothetical protein
MTAFPCCRRSPDLEVLGHHWCTEGAPYSRTGVHPPACGRQHAHPEHADVPDGGQGLCEGRSRPVAHPGRQRRRSAPAGYAAAHHRPAQCTRRPCRDLRAPLLPHLRHDAARICRTDPPFQIQGGRHPGNRSAPCGQLPPCDTRHQGCAAVRFPGRGQWPAAGWGRARVLLAHVSAVAKRTTL